MSADVIGAFLAGVASILGAGFSMRRVRRSEREDCARRIAELRDAHERGLQAGLHLSERRDA